MQRLCNGYPVACMHKLYPQWIRTAAGQKMLKIKEAKQQGA
jgi:hypothetical protein